MNPVQNLGRSVIERVEGIGAATILLLRTLISVPSCAVLVCLSSSSIGWACYPC